MRICDRIVTVGLLLLLLCTPLAFGAVFSWARTILQVSAGLLVVVWLAKVLLTWRIAATQPACRSVRPFVLPLLLFLSFLFFQLLPLPPSLLHSLSPATYNLYTQTLPGWPQQAPYTELMSLQVQAPQSAALAAALDPAPTASSSQPSWFDIPWYPLSVAPDLGRTDLLALLAYASLFFVVACYPFGQANSAEQSRAETRFLRVVLVAILGIGLFIALLGIVQRATWNGKLLWFFVPAHWDGPRLYLSRANGPFINANHFANYLALIFPLLLASSAFRTFVVPSGWDKPFRVVCGMGVLVVFMALLLSLSRGGWMATLVGTGLVFWAALRVSDHRTSRRRRPQRSPVRLVLVGFSVLLFFSLLVMGPSGRTSLDVRLEQTATEEIGLSSRVATWQDSLGMIQDFPLLGVGLGGWPTLFQRYQRPPWSSVLWKEAHNDYIECLAETGLIGLGLLAWFFWRIGRRLIRGFPALPPAGLPVYAALCAALMGMAVHEVFDFSLQIPANAVLFSVLLALAVRMATKDWGPAAAPAPASASPSRPVLVGGIGALICVPGLLALAPKPVSLVEEPASFAEAREVLLTYPTAAFAHLSLFYLLEEAERPATQLQELEIALWLDPRDPFLRDLYAQELRQQGNEAAGLAEISRSLFFSPSLSTHLDFPQDNIPLLSETEQAAVEAGLKQALAAGYPGALAELGRLYALLGRFTDQAQVYAEAARTEKDPAKQFQYLLNAGLAYGEAELLDRIGFAFSPAAYPENPENIDASELQWIDSFWTDPEALEKAEQLLRQAAEIAPRDPKPYKSLVDSVFTLQADLSAAKDVVALGIERGADPFPLYVALGKAARILQDEEEAKKAFQKALDLQPHSFTVHAQLGRMYMQSRNYNQATLALRKAGEVDPNKAWVFYYLGIAEERSFRFFEADKAYAKAIELAPQNEGYQERYMAFQQRVAANLEAEDE